VISLLITILIGWLILKLLWPRASIYCEPPAPIQITTIHLHQPVIVLTKAEPPIL
jgi:hypothetical protein